MYRKSARGWEKHLDFMIWGPVEFTDRIFIGLYVKKWP